MIGKDIIMARQQYKIGTSINNLLILGQILLSITLILVDFSNSSITCGPGIYSPGGKYTDHSFNN